MYTHIIKCCIVVATVMWWAVWADGAPAHGTLRMDLSEVLDKAVCPIRVVIDEDKTRVPRLIKTLVCDKKPSAVCTSTKTSHACCHHHHHTFSTQCVEVMDRVLVRYEGSETPVPLQVPVGCTCMIRESKPTKDSS